MYYSLLQVLNIAAGSGAPTLLACTTLISNVALRRGASAPQLLHARVELPTGDVRVDVQTQHDAALQSACLTGSARACTDAVARAHNAHVMHASAACSVLGTATPAQAVNAAPDMAGACAIVSVDEAHSHGMVQAPPPAMDAALTIALVLRTASLERPMCMLASAAGIFLPRHKRGAPGCRVYGTWGGCTGRSRMPMCS